MQKELGFAERFFRNGTYGGTLYVVQSGSPVSEAPLQLNLTFSGGVVSGDGQCSLLAEESFAVEGKYSDQAPYDLECQAKGLAVTFIGAREKDGGLQGRWRHATDGDKTGLFELLHVGQALDPQDAIKTLVEMGMAPEAAELAVNVHHMSVEEAVEWIGSGCPPVGEADPTEANAEHVASIMEMGFSEEEAKNALLANQNDVQRALNMLLG
eukprot:EG_transcript_26465